MNYLRSMDYLEGKTKLEGEFKKAFLTIEDYYIQVYTDGRYEIQFSLKKILNDFLIAQQSGSSLEIITGPDIKDYAINIIEEVDNAKKGPLYWITTVIGIVFLLLFIILSQALLSDGNKGYTFIEKMRHMNFSLYFIRDILVLIIFICLLSYFQTKITRKLFYRPGKIRIIHFIYTLTIVLLTMFYMDNTRPYGDTLSFQMPILLFLIPFLLTTTYIIAVAFLSYRKTKAKKQALMEYEEIDIAQITCPSCGYIHDIDYPKCPKCGYHNEQE